MTAKKLLGRPCSICTLPPEKRAALDRSLKAGANPARLARAHGVSPYAVRRHAVHLDHPTTPTGSRRRGSVSPGVGTKPPAGDGASFADLEQSIRADMAKVALDPDLPLADKARAYADLSATLVRITRAGDSVELTEAEVVAMPAFQRLMTEIGDALEQHPAALQAVVEVLRRAEPTEASPAT